ncbi:MAG: OmpA family protein [Chromatiaceae bacterium]|nr:MAG: OmpA family protein [Chromatiaceae bacterium]
MHCYGRYDGLGDRRSAPSAAGRWRPLRASAVASVPGLALVLAIMVSIAGCAGGGRPLTEAERGVGLGAAAGAAAGALIGSTRADAGKGALIGAVGGALAGGLVGSYMDRQRQDFERVLAEEIAAGAIRLEKLPDHRLIVSMTSATTFAVDSARIEPGFFSTLDKIAEVVNRYGKTELIIAGHTDNTGSAAHNLALSERRAGAVETYLLGAGVLPIRMTSVGYGLTRPVASNETEAGRRLNRRVDVVIIPLVEGA